MYRISKYILLGLIILGVNFSLAIPSQADSPEAITDYSTDITINKDSSLNIVETISYDFGQNQRHGIFRKIPYKYNARGGNYELRLSNFKVTDQSGTELNFDQSKSDGEVVIKIGDADKYVTGSHQYKISYSVSRGINYFADHDELYWNAIGSEWTVPILKAETMVHAPGNITSQICYIGFNGATNQDCKITGGNTNTVSYVVNRALQPSEEFTIVAGLPVGTLTKPSPVKRLWDTIADNIVLGLPLLAFVIMFLIWRKYGRDTKSSLPIVAQYQAPDNLSSMYMGGLLGDQVSNKDVAAEVVYLATKGFLAIARVKSAGIHILKKDDYQFSRVAQTEDKLLTLPRQTRILLDTIFYDGRKEVLMSDLQKSMLFGRRVADIKRDVMKELTASKYFRSNPAYLRVGMIGPTIFLTVILCLLLGNLIGYLGVIAGVVTGIVVMIFEYLMPAPTQKGADAVVMIKGLRLYLTVAEKDRLKFHNSPQKDPQHFEALLPYAIVLGVEKEWAEQFHDLTAAPSWYTDTVSSYPGFNAVMFSNDMGSFTTHMQSAATTSSAAGGGSGFGGGGAGGGFGGGGGGSW